jgi:hypothetical protein
LALAAERRQDFNDASKEYIARYQKNRAKTVKQPSSTERVPCEKCGSYAKIARTETIEPRPGGSIRSLLGS